MHVEVERHHDFNSKDHPHARGVQGFLLSSGNLGRTKRPQHHLDPTVSIRTRYLKARGKICIPFNTLKNKNLQLNMHLH